VPPPEVIVERIRDRTRIRPVARGQLRRRVRRQLPRDAEAIGRGVDVRGRKPLLGRHQDERERGQRVGALEPRARRGDHPVARRHLARHVRAEVLGDQNKPFVVERHAPLPERIGRKRVERAQDGGRVGRAAAEPGGDRDALVDPRAPVRIDPCSSHDGPEGALDQRVLREALDADARR